MAKRKLDIFDVIRPDIKVVSEKEEKKTSGTNIFDFLKDVTYQKKYIYDDITSSQYNPYIVNRYLSADMSTALYAQEMNERASLDKKLQHDYYFYAIRKKSRFLKWIKKEKDENIALIMKYYSCNVDRAKEYLGLLSKEYISDLRKYDSEKEGGEIKRSK